MAKATSKAASTEATSEPSESGSVTLSNLRPAEGAVRKRLRVGRGRASGAGKTCNRGHNGEGQRSGNSNKRGFEGGQMPGYRRQPKFRTFPNPNKKHWLELNAGDLDKLIPDTVTEVTYQVLVELGLLRQRMDGLRVLGNGEVSKKFTVHAHHVTPGARKKIEAAGGTIQLVDAAEKPVKKDASEA